MNITELFAWWSAFIGENKLAGVYFIDFLLRKSIGRILLLLL